MHTKLNRQVLVYVLCIALFMTLGTRFLPSNKVSADVTDNLSASLLTITDGNIIMGETLQLFSPQLPETTNLVQPALQEEVSEPITNSSLEIHSAIVPPSVQEPSIHTYEVTAFYLNVREQPDANSNIIEVLKQGDTIEVSQTLDNGWLALKDKGFVHGRYAEKMEESGAVATVAAAAPEVLAKANTIVAELPLNDTLKIKPSQTPEPSDPEKPTSTVESDSGLTEEHIAKLFEKTALADHGLEKAVLDIEQEYGINAYFTIAVMKLESGNGKSTLAKKKNNLFGLNAIDSDKYNRAFSFKTKGDSVHKFGQLLAKNYVDKGFTTIDKIARKYCPANPKWASLVMNIMKKDYKKL